MAQLNHSPPWATLQWAESYLNRMHVEWIQIFQYQNSPEGTVTQNNIVDTEMPPRNPVMVWLILNKSVKVAGKLQNAAEIGTSSQPTATSQENKTNNQPTTYNQTLTTSNHNNNFNSSRQVPTLSGSGVSSSGAKNPIATGLRRPRSVSVFFLEMILVCIKSDWF